MNIGSLSGVLGRVMAHTTCLTLMVLALVLLIGCAETGQADQAELQAWMKSERAKHVPPVQLPPAPAHYQKPIDTLPQGVEPFSGQRLLRTMPGDVPRPAATTLLTPAPRQTRPPLDALPLAGMRLVGSLQRGGETVAMLRVQGMIYSVRVGDKIGQDQGRVSAITLSGLVVREVALNAVGQQSERAVSLALVQEP